MLAPLHDLLKKGIPWSWKASHQKAFDTSKQQLCSDTLLVHYDLDKKLILSCDASPYGVGAVLSHVMEDGSERPIGFASRTLAPAEKKYSQLDKEGLAIIVGIKKFHQHVYGRSFQITSDHKPLLGLLGENKGVPVMASARMQRWALTLAAYEYRLVYKGGKDNGDSDALSRLPLPSYPIEVPVPGEVIQMLERLENTPLDAAQIKQWTRTDPVLSQVLLYTTKGWPNSCSMETLKPYFTRKDEISIQDGCLLWGSRVIVPSRGRQRVLDELHSCHPGMTKMKGLARSTLWWPNLDQAIEDKVKSCHTCQVNQNAPAKAPLYPWEWPERPWSRIHIDHAGPYHNQLWLIIVDAHSKWLDIYPVSSTNSQTTIDMLRVSFSNHGLPEMIVSDNAASFTSAQFAEFCDKNGIHHVTSAPYHPASNGLAERAVQSFKRGFDRMGEGSSKTKLARFLLQYHNAPQGTTGQSPAELLMGRRLRSHLDLLHPNLSQRVQRRQRCQKEQHDQHARERSIEIGDRVYSRNFSGKPVWLSGVVTERSGPVSYCVKLDDNNCVIRRHQDHIRRKTDRDDVSNPPDIEQRAVGDPAHPFDLLPAPLLEPPQIDTLWHH